MKNKYPTVLFTKIVQTLTNVHRRLAFMVPARTVWTNGLVTAHLDILVQTVPKVSGSSFVAWQLSKDVQNWSHLEINWFDSAVICSCWKSFDFCCIEDFAFNLVDESQHLKKRTFCLYSVRDSLTSWSIFQQYLPVFPVVVALARSTVDE